ncbi:MAG: alpha/beta fold hydrolase, partial [Pseudomonadota bacterium]|nr:alpha/beta fold hydrolase [Pseudomonadota bacterium]
RIRTVRHRLAFLLTVILLWSSIASGAKPDEPVATSAPAEAASRGETAVKISVFYLTNRKRYQGKPVADTYSGERGEAHFGRCEVEFTPIPIINQVASRMPFYLKSETNLVSLAEQADAPLFWEQLGAAIERTSSGSVVLFVHGYNYGFERTCRMAAEMQRSLQDKATVLAFSWPSNALPTDYVRDQADIEWSVPVLANLIRQLGDRIGKANVQVVAHSLGSRGVIFALQRLAFERIERPAIGPLVLLAPDFDSQTFVDLLPGLAPLVGSITLYASDNDTPLKLSRQLSGYPRLGEAGAYLTVVEEGMDTIDVSSIGRYQLTGHEYFYFHPLVTADLVALLSTGARAAQRPGLQAKKRDGIRYWGFTGAVDNDGPAPTVDD